MKALLGFIFGGSQAIAHMQVGWEVDRILEISEDIKETNSYHFVRNYPNIDVVVPSIWENDQYLKSLNGKYDLCAFNNPCSGLSQINRNASVDQAANIHFYRVFNIIDKVNPKAFLIENAPTLVNRGLPILKDMDSKLGDKYRFTIINDFAGNHDVCMQRRRTLVIGWNKDYFDGIPSIDQIKNNKFTVGDALKGLSNDTPNMEPVSGMPGEELLKHYKYTLPGETIMRAISKHLDECDVDDKTKEEAIRVSKKHAEGKSVWDKSSLRLVEDGIAPSITSINQYMHPTENRDLYLREYARLMGYPDDFIFYEGGKISPVQCIAQGVPVNFIKYISKQIIEALQNKKYEDVSNDIVYINQTSGLQKIVRFTREEFSRCEKIDVNNKSLQEVSLF